MEKEKEKEKEPPAADAGTRQGASRPHHPDQGSDADPGAEAGRGNVQNCVRMAWRVRDGQDITLDRNATSRYHYL